MQKYTLYVVSVPIERKVDVLVYAKSAVQASAFAAVHAEEHDHNDYQLRSNETARFDKALVSPSDEVVRAMFSKALANAEEKPRCRVLGYKDHCEAPRVIDPAVLHTVSTFTEEATALRLSLKKRTVSVLNTISQLLGDRSPESLPGFTELIAEVCEFTVALADAESTTSQSVTALRLLAKATTSGDQRAEIISELPRIFRDEVQGLRAYEATASDLLARLVLLGTQLN